MNEQAYFEQFTGDVDEPWAVTHSNEYIHRYYDTYADAVRARIELGNRYPDMKFGMIPTKNGIPIGMRIFPIPGALDV